MRILLAVTLPAAALFAPVIVRAHPNHPSDPAAAPSTSVAPASSESAVEAPATEAPQEVNVSGVTPPRSASETVRDRRVIGAAPHRTGGDLLLVVPGVFITQHSGQGKAYQIFFRGFDAVHGQDIEFEVGGAPVNEVSNIHGQGYADLHFVMPEVVREIKSTPGTYSPRQGDFAVAGSIRFGLGYDEPGVTAKATVGSFGERRYFLAYHPEGTAETTFGAFETQSTDGFGPSRAARRTSVMGQHVFGLGHGLSLRVLAQAFAARFDSAGVLRRSDIDSGAVDRFDTYDPHQGGFSSRSSLVLELAHVHPSEDGVARGGEWSISPFFIYRTLKLRQNYTGYLEHKDDGDSSQQINEAMTFGATALYRKGLPIFSPSDSIEVGLQMRNDWIDQSQLALGAVDDRVLATVVKSKIRATNAAGWLDLGIKPLKRLSVRAGVRFDGLAYGSEDDAPAAGRSTRVGSSGTVLDPTASGQARSAMGTHIGPKITLDYRVIGGLHAVASYGEGFRSPQARSLGEGERTPFTTVKSAEVGLRHRDGEWMQGSLAVFRTWLSDDLVFDPATARNEKVPKTTRVGFAAEYSMTPTPWFVSSGSATYTRATFAASDSNYGTGDLVPYVPQLVMRQDIAFTPVLGTVGKRKLRGRFGGALTGLFGRPLPYGETGADVFLVDASAAVRLGEVELGLDCFNVLGAKWFDGQFVYASNWSRGANPQLVPAQHVTVGTPRALLATLSVYL